jgi:hypothetical protein
VTVGGDPDQADQVLGPGVLEEKTGGPSAEGAQNVGVQVERGQHDDLW